MILAIDPGPVESAWGILDENLKPVHFGIYLNEVLLNDLNMDRLQWLVDCNIKYFAIEMVASYGMAVGKEVFETCVWIGRFWQEAQEFHGKKFIYRKEVKMNLCQNMRAKDSNIRQALIDRFGAVGTKKNQGWFYGVSKDVWSAIAVGVTYADKYLKQKTA